MNGLSGHKHGQFIYKISWSIGKCLIYILTYEDHTNISCTNDPPVIYDLLLGVMVTYTKAKKIQKKLKKTKKLYVIKCTSKIGLFCIYMYS